MCEKGVTYGRLAQLAERVAVNHCVIGSSPIFPAIWRVPERLGTSLENLGEVKLYRVRLPGSPPISQTDTESGDSVRITPAAVNRCIGRGDLRFIL